MTIILNGSNGVTFPDSSLQAAAASPYVLKNRIINGDMRIDQRNAGASVTPINGQYTLDRWSFTTSQPSKLTSQQNQGSVTLPNGFSNYLGITSSSSYSVLTGDTFLVRQSIEGFNIADLAWGTANAKTVTLSFLVYSSLTGTFGGALTNSAANRSYPFSYTISSANTWTTISITIVGDTTGTWLTNNGIGIDIRFGLGSGSTFSGTSGAWTASNLVQPTGTVSVVGTNGATWYVTGVQLEAGTSATPFERRLYNQELANCQRYYWTTVAGNPLLVNNLVGGVNRLPLPLNPVSMRTTATITYYTSAGVAGSLTEFSSATVRVVSSTTNLQAIGGGWLQTSTNFANPAEFRAEFSAEL